MRYSPLLLLALLVACEPDGTEVAAGPSGPGPMLSPGTCTFTVNKVGTDPISAPTNTSGLNAGSWFLKKDSASTGVTIVGEVLGHSGQVTSVSSSGWASFPVALPTYPSTIDADVNFATGSAGTGGVTLQVRYVCADGTDTLTKTLRQMGFGFTVNVS